MSDLRKQKEWNSHSGAILDTVKNFDVIDCMPCGFKHIVPIPTLAEMKDVYRGEYYTKDHPLCLNRQEEDLDWWNLVFSGRYSIFEDLLPNDRRRILDVGSGSGFFLSHGKKRGWETMGIEPSTQAYEHSKNLGLEIVPDFLTEESAPGLGTFDVVHLSEVLEHISDPTGMVGIIKKVVKPGGLICIVVPNDYNPFQKALVEACDFDPWWVAPPHHINYFDFDSLSGLILRLGFVVVVREATFPIDMFLLMGENYVGDDRQGRLSHGKRKLFEQNLEQAGSGHIKTEFYRKMAELGIGREVMLVGRLNT